MATPSRLWERFAAVGQPWRAQTTPPCKARGAARVTMRPSPPDVLSLPRIIWDAFTVSHTRPYIHSMCQAVPKLAGIL